MKIEVTVLDTETGKTRMCDRRSREFWETGNGACDCNRALLFHSFVEEANREEIGGVCLGCKRYLIVEAPVGCSLSEMNAGYPLVLRAKYLPTPKGID